MRTILLLLAFCASTLGAVGNWNGVAFTAWNGVAQTSWNGTGISCASGVTYLVEETFEGAGTPTDWTTTGTGTIDFDNTIVVIDGAQSLMLTAVSQTPRAISPTFAAQGEIWVYFKMIVVSLPSASVGLITVKNASAAQVMRIRVTATGLINVQSATGGANTTDAVSAGTLYHVLGHYLKGTGADAIVDVEFNTTGTWTGTGNKFKQLTNGDATTDAVSFELGHNASTTFNNVYDRVLAAASQIGNSP